MYAIEIIPAQPDTTTEMEFVDSLPVKFSPFFQLALGISKRTDEANLIEYSSMYHVKLYYHLSDKISTKFGVGYSSVNNFKSDNWETINYRNLKLETGFRWNLIQSFFLLYHENGFEYDYYYVPHSTIWEHRIGVNFSFGINVEIHKLFFLDIAVGQTFNSVNFTPTKNFDPSVSPIGIKDDKFFNEIFNPFSLQILLFKRL